MARKGQFRTCLTSTRRRTSARNRLIHTFGNMANHALGFDRYIVMSLLDLPCKALRGQTIAKTTVTPTQNSKPTPQQPQNESYCIWLDWSTQYLPSTQHITFYLPWLLSPSLSLSLPVPLLPTIFPELGQSSPPP